MEYITISSIGHYAYCPKSAWFMLVGYENVDNVPLVEGRLLHGRVDSGEQTVRRDLVQGRTVPLYSDTYGLIGITDLVEEAGGTWYPVEYKKGKDGDWRNHQVQLCAQALCLEEMLTLPHPIAEGYIYYAASGKRRKVALDKKLRGLTVKLIEATRKVAEHETPPAVKYSAKCPECSWYPVCLPKETERVRRMRGRRS